MKEIIRTFVRIALMLAAPCLPLVWCLSYHYALSGGYGCLDTATPPFFWGISASLDGGQLRIVLMRCAGQDALDMLYFRSEFRRLDLNYVDVPSPAVLNDWGWVDVNHSGFNGVIAGCGYRWFANNGTQTTIWFNDIFVHMWLVCAAYIAAVALIMYRARRRRMRQRSGLCHKCNYDLRASKDRCPECGTPIPKPEASSKPASDNS